MGEVKVIGSLRSLFCTRIEWALKLKGVEYEYLQEDLPNKSPILLKYNPVHKKVPVFVHGDRPIAESLIILEYIDETWKDNPLMPEDPFERSMARFWATFADDKCLFGAWDTCWPEPESEKKKKAIQSAEESFQFLENQIQGKKFFHGENIGYLDLVMGWIPHWLNVMKEGMDILDSEKFPSLHEWTQNFIEVPLIKECLPLREKLVDYFSRSVGYMRSTAANTQ